MGPWVLQADGPEAFTANEPFMPLGSTLLSWRALQSRGCQVCPALGAAVCSCMDAAWACQALNPSTVLPGHVCNSERCHAVLLPMHQQLLCPQQQLRDNY